MYSNFSFACRWTPTCLARRVHKPVCPDSICNRITAAVIRIQACLKLSVSLRCSSGSAQSKPPSNHNNTQKNKTTFAEWSSSVSLRTWLSVLLLICTAARSEQVTVAVSGAEFGLRNGVFSWALSKIQLMTPPPLSNHYPFMPLISHPDL